MDKNPPNNCSLFILHYQLTPSAFDGNRTRKPPFPWIALMN